MERRSRLYEWCYVAAGIDAVCVTVLSLAALSDLGPEDPRVWYVIAPLFVVIAWGGFLAWRRQAWGWAALAFVITGAAPWGLFYAGPVLALLLAGGALVLRAGPTEPAGRAERGRR